MRLAHSPEIGAKFRWHSAAKPILMRQIPLPQTQLICRQGFDIKIVSALIGDFEDALKRDFPCRQGKGFAPARGAEW
jgi:hypothetical protein